MLIDSLSIFTDAEGVRELLQPEVPLGGSMVEHVFRSIDEASLDGVLREELELGVRSYNCLKRAGI